MAVETLTSSAPAEALSPRELRLRQVARLLQVGAGACALAALLVFAAGVIAALRLAPSLPAALHAALIAGYRGADDIALAVVILLSLVNMSALLVAMVGVLAREVWALPALLIIALLNGAALALLGFTPGVIAIGTALLALLIAVRDVGAYRVNPVMLKELRGRMRGMRAFVVITVYLGLMSGFAVLIYLLYTSANRLTTTSAAAGEIGRVLFMGVVGVELLLILFIAPAFTAGAITGERERQTYDLLQTTLLAVPSFVMGKLESALGYILLLLLAAIPLQSIAFLFGGVSELELLLSFVILAVSAVTFGTVGIYFSAAVSKTLTASVRAYSVMIVVTFGVPVLLGIILGIVQNALYGFGANNANSPVLEGALTYAQLLLTSMNPVAVALGTQDLLANRQVLGFYAHTLTDGSTIPLASPWITFTILYLAASALLIVITIRRTRTEASLD